MRLTGVLVTVGVSLVLQTLLARYTAGIRWSPDLVLVGVVYAGLRWGPVAGMLAGTLGGLMQDMIVQDIVGVGGLTKTLIGFAVGVVGAQFVLVRPQGRVVIVAVATILHRVMLAGMYNVIGGRSGVIWSDVLIQTGLNALAALIAFQMTESLPGALERGRANRRATLSRRKW